MNTSRLVVILMLLVFFVPSVAGFCKWVDENGATHYAETCPEDVESSEVETHATPIQEQVDEAKIRSQQSQEKTKVQKETTVVNQPVFRPRHTPAEIRKMENERQEIQCVSWRAELARLEQRREWHEIQIDLKKLLNDNKCK